MDFDRTVGSKIQKTIPCLIASPDEMNRHIRTVIVAPMFWDGGMVGCGMVGTGSSS